MMPRARPTVIRCFWGALGVALATLVPAGAGCGGGVSGSGGTGDGAGDPAPFVGTWLYTDVQSVLQCPNADPTNQLPEPNKTFAHGVSAALVDLSPSPLLPGVFCDFGFDVTQGAVATAQPNQICALTSLDSLTIDQAAGNGPPLWTFTLNSATTAEEIVQATAHFQVAGAPETCSWNLAAHLTRISKD
jgi:hypothetical protein